MLQLIHSCNVPKSPQEMQIDSLTSLTQIYIYYMSFISIFYLVSTNRVISFLPIVRDEKTTKKAPNPCILQ